MARIEKTVFISYRRTDVYTALAVYESLKNQGYDVFFDYRSISSGDFEQIITSNIRARAHFLLILTQTALERCKEPGDWLRREIEIAIDEKRNIVPLFFKGFRFGSPSVSENLTGKLRNLSRYNGLNVHEDYFEEAMYRLCTQYLSIPLNTVLHPVSTEVRKVVLEEQFAADKALEQIEDVQELVKSDEVKLNVPKGEADPKPIEFPREIRREDKRIEKPPVTPSQESPSPGKRDVSGEVQSRTSSAKRKVLLTPQLRLFIGVAGGLLLTTLCIMGGVNYLSNFLFDRLVTTTPTPTNPFTTTSPSEPVKTNTPSPTETSISPTSTLRIGSTMISEKDGMTLLYVPAGEFTMGSDNGGANEKPVHTIYLDAFWIDKTEVTNKVYALCVSAGACEEPASKTSNTHSSYYGNDNYDNYPVIYVDWNMAKAYCEWAGRRLTTEAEWEKAARGENAFTYPWGNDAPNNNLLNYDNAVGDTTEVGTYSDGKSIYGALDMAGNVWEWVNDWYDVYPGGDASADRDFGQKYRVLRGGAWLNFDNLVRSAIRDRAGPAKSYNVLGFRCSRPP